MNASDSLKQESNTITTTAKPDGPVILQVLPSLETGGVERGTVDIAGAINDAGWTALVASSGGTMVRDVERAGARHIELPLDAKNPWVMWANARRLERLIAEYKIDILHARSRAPAWSALLAAKRTGVKFVTTFHGSYNAASPLKRWYNSVMTRGDSVIAISNYIGGEITGRYGADPARVKIIPRGVDTDLFDPAAVSAERLITLATQWRLPDGAPVIMLPGRLSRWKGQLVLVEALARLGRRDVRCIIVGSDQGRTGYARQLEADIARLGVDDIVHVIGQCRDMAAAYMLADVVVSASTDPEAFGRVAVEAQAMGRPVIATDHGAARETVLAGETGWLVPPGDASALTQVLRDALAIDADTREAMADRAMSHVRANYSKVLMCVRTLAVYRSLLEDAEPDRQA
ncbi:MAG: glycosyltransferase family 4 protein [Alphaproteobacteria bacterium]